MPIHGGSSLSLSEIAQAVWRGLEEYDEPSLYHADDNDTTYVTVCNITGRGILTHIAASGDGSNDVVVTAKITIDAGTPVEVAIGKIASTCGYVGHALFSGFSTSCKVEMKLDQSSVIKFDVATLEE